MPYKHQTESYRTIKGERYICWGDLLGDPDSEAALETCKRHRIPHRVVKIGDFRRLFVKETHAYDL